MLTTHRRLRSNSVLAVPRFTRRAQLIVPARFGDRVIYRHIIRELLALDRRDPARRRRVDEKFGPLAHFARRFPSLQDARQFLEGEPSLPHSVAVIRNAIAEANHDA